jgi:hypothetical protein
MILTYRDIDDFLETSVVPDDSQLSTKRERFYYFKRIHIHYDNRPGYEKYLDKTVVLSSAQIKYLTEPSHKWSAMNQGWIGKFEIDQLVAIKQANKDSGINTDF